jgi:hypothetical protein
MNLMIYIVLFYILKKTGNSQEIVISVLTHSIKNKFNFFITNIDNELE